MVPLHLDWLVSINHGQDWSGLDILILTKIEIGILKAPRFPILVEIGDPKSPQKSKWPARLSGIDQDHLRLVGDSRGNGIYQDYIDTYQFAGLSLIFLLKKYFEN